MDLCQLMYMYIYIVYIIFYCTVLADLPLPVALPTPTEESLLGAAKKLSADTKRLLDSTNSTTCSKVAETLLSVDMSFL